MQKKIIFLALILIAFSCGGLKETNINSIKNKKIFIDYVENGDLGRVKVNFTNSTRSNNENIIFFALDKIGEIVKDLGSQFSSSIIENKLNNTFQKINIKEILTNNFGRALSIYSNSEITTNEFDNFDFIAKFNLEKFQITANNDGIFLEMKINFDFIRKSDLKILWSDKSNIKTQLDFNEYKTNGKKLTELKRLYDLATISDEKIYNTIHNSTKKIINSLTDSFIHSF